MDEEGCVRVGGASRSRRQLIGGSEGRDQGKWGICEFQVV